MNESMKLITILLLGALAWFGGKAYGEDYKRSLYMSSWKDYNHDGQSTRQEVLIEENLAPDSLTVYNEDSSRIISGLWVCPYTGDTITDPSKLDIDHLVPLKEAHLSGGYNWSKEQRHQYANDLNTNENHLVAVKASANRSKGAKDPAHWMPEINQCWYILEWLRVKQIWGLSADPVETQFIQIYLDEHESCRDYDVELPPVH